MDVNAVSKAVDGQTAQAIAAGTAENGNRAEAIANAIGAAEGIRRNGFLARVLGYLLIRLT